ncbi:protein TsetseEP isoform X2 [Scleropages formosus]|uniref:protein TsetseEP isoform X2 n=1 Tax=Scleropages formosus TaxID=113540 RepID=UPI0008783918|nr:matrix-remodeling-associated protein 7 isoform X2 [Scleropages formosus]
MTMDVMFDLSFVVPAVLFTILAVILASSLLGKNRAPVPKCDHQRVHDAPAERVPAEDEIRGEVRQAAAPREEVQEVQAEAETGVTGGDEEEPEATAGPPVVENVGAVKEEPLGEARTKDDGQETILKPVSAPTWKEEPNAEPMLAPVLESLPPPDTEKEINAEATPTATSGTVPPSQPEQDPLSEPTASASSELQTLTVLTPQSTFEPCPEQIPESSQLPLQEIAAESSPVKVPTMRNNDAAPPLSQEEEEALKYVPGKLRTSQFEKLMTKEELEEEQRKEE